MNTPHKYSIGDIVVFDRKELNVYTNRGTIWELTSKTTTEGEIIPTYTIRVSFYVYVHSIPEDKITGLIAKVVSA